MIDDFAKALDAELAGFDIGVVDDGNFATGICEEFDDGFSGEFSALKVIGGDVAFDAGIGAGVFDVVGEDRDSGLIGFANGGADGFGVTGVEYDGGGALNDEVLNLCRLLVDILITGNDDEGVAAFFGFGLHGIGDDAEEGVGECEGGVADAALV
ncbi:MAG: hypothetical protein RL215_342 [Planctomycetota bacterium]